MVWPGVRVGGWCILYIPTMVVSETESMLITYTPICKLPGATVNTKKSGPTGKYSIDIEMISRHLR